MVGLPYDAVFYITQADPSSLTLLDIKDAKKVRIEVAVLPSSETRPTVTQQQPRPQPAPQVPAPMGARSGAALLVASYGDWGVYRKQRECFALSQPKRRAPTQLANVPGYLFVSVRPQVRNEISVMMNVRLKEGSIITCGLVLIILQWLREIKTFGSNQPAMRVLSSK